jgi:hypothetical protein
MPGYIAIAKRACGSQRLTAIAQFDLVECLMHSRLLRRPAVYADDRGLLSDLLRLLQIQRRLQGRAELAGQLQTQLLHLLGPYLDPRIRGEAAPAGTSHREPARRHTEHSE